MQRPADPTRLSPVPPPPAPPAEIIPLKYVIIALLAAVGLVYLEEPPRSWGALIYPAIVIGLHCLWRYWARRPVLPLPAAAVPDHQLPARSAPAQSFSRSVKNYLELPLLLALTVLLYVLFWLQFQRGKEIGVLTYTFGLLFYPLVLGYMVYVVSKPQVWRWTRLGYDAATDSFRRAHAFYLNSFKEEERWPAADFIGIYWEERPDDYSGNGRNLATALWLAGRAGGADLCLLELHYWHRDNRRRAQQLTAELSKASGLPQLYRWPVDENS